MKFFVTGGAGLFGSHIIPLLLERGHEVTAPSKEQFNVAINAREKVVDNAFGLRTDIDVVVNLAAYTDVARAEGLGSYSAFAVNPAVEWITDLPCRVQVFHLSTDYVYNGYVDNSCEGDLLEPFNVYGRSKAMADMKLLSVCNPSTHIIRTSFKPKKWPYGVAFSDMFTNADTVDVIARMVADFIELDPPGGIWNIGTEMKTVYELAKKNNPDVAPSSVENVKFLRPCVTMDLTKYREFMEKCRAS